ncbi:tetratricopeptide repeat protein [Catenulispora sp. NF23]|uniref:Tetratricopeptide repeat protein n=1 Tax=Catenulispora pinistramenti TaxID=2705254 RepID=A0ABS5L6H4_9ACTN|nr:tetratricopeptide repeat protein [Catenulispora pinistramenti]MBS2539575.1 tetratricopeptide repeat protein [Catenulispora pinistramenti]MBS2553847.1 tetratricopeptide repeat protein [Catenulispora pinistramenti]
MDVPQTKTEKTELLNELDRWRKRAARGTGRARVSLRELSAATGIPRSTLSDYLSGATLMPPDLLDAVVLALGATPAQARQWADAWEQACEEHHDPRPQDSGDHSGTQAGGGGQSGGGQSGGGQSGGQSGSHGPGPGPRTGSSAGPGTASSPGPGPRLGTSSSPSPATGFSPGPGPQQLPTDTAAFTGRTSELAELNRLLDPSIDRSREDGPEAVAVAVIAGTAGVGKTTLAIHWAHTVRHRFADGQLYLNLRGYDPGEPMSPEVALEQVLRALGAQSVPADLDGRAALYRTLLSDQRVLVVLDNARSAEQVRPLLPGTAGCLTVVTSRDSLAGLVARDGARRVALERLTDAEALGLLEQLLGRHRVLSEPRASADLIRLCAALPLALCVAAERVGRRRAGTFAGTVAELADEAGRLDTLGAGGDPLTDVRAVFSWSVRVLPNAAARLFRLLGVCPGPDIDVFAAANLAGVSAAVARRLLDTLADANLLDVGPADRYRMHDLLRDYARELAFAVDAETDRSAALTALADWRLHTASAAMDHVAPERRELPDRIPVPAVVGPNFSGVHDASAWLQASRAGLVDAVRHAAQSASRASNAHSTPGRSSEHAWRLAVTIWRFFYTRRYLDDWFDTTANAMTAARRLGNRFAEAELLHILGVAHDSAARYEDSLECFEQALLIRRETGDRPGEALTLNGVGGANYRLRRLQCAAQHLRMATDLARELDLKHLELMALGNLALLQSDMGQYEEGIKLFSEILEFRVAVGEKSEQAVVLNNLGRLHHRVGHAAEALSFLGRARALAEELDNRHNLASILDALAAVHARAGYRATAEAQAKQALELARATDNHNEQTAALTTLGMIHFSGGQLAAALFCCRQALTICREYRQPGNEPAVHNSLGEILLALGEPDAALGHHRKALAVAIEANPYEQARAEQGTGAALRALNRDAEAWPHLDTAAELFEQLGVPEAGPARACLVAYG